MFSSSVPIPAGASGPSGFMDEQVIRRIQDGRD
jgi:hypothetical protein